VGLTFLYPAFLIATAAVAIPVVLHLMRRRTHVVVDFPAVRLLKKAPVENQRRRRLRELLLLALRMIALALLAFAFARPYFQSATSALPAPVTVVAVDTSLSLSAPGQFERVRQAARRAVNEAPATHAIALVSFADAATLLVPPTTDRGGTLSAIDQLRPTAGGTRFRTALARAAESVKGGEGAIVVVTDLQQAGWDANDEGAVPDGIGISVVEIPPPVGNLAVTSARRDGAGIVAAVHNFASAGARVAVQLRIADKDVARQMVDIAPQAAADVRFTTPLPARGGAEIRVDDREGYQGDNSRFLVLDPPPATPIVVVTAEPPGSSNAGLYIERALTVADEERSLAVRVVDGRAFSASSGEAAEFGAIILLGTTTLDRTGRERIATFLRSGGRGLLTLGPDIDLATLDETVGTRIVVDQTPAKPGERIVTLIAVDTRHPIFRPFLSPTGALGDVYVDTFRRLNVGSGGTVLARFSGAGDALIEQQVERGRLLVFASDLDNRWNRFPLNPAFVPWAVEMARYLVQGREVQQSYTLPNVPGGVAAEPGIHRLGDRPITVNTDVRESNPAYMTLEAFVGGVTRVASSAAAQAVTEAREQEERQRLWQIGLLVLFVALVGEGFIGRKAF
jgi:Aerotolerance regulator N-terminal/von Willebrand factor type A domain